MRAFRFALLALLIGTLAPLPAAAPEDDFVPLREALDPELQAGLEATLERLNLAGPVARKRLSVALAGITHVECPRLAAVNGDRMMYAASLPKIAILLAAMRRVQDGELELGPEDEKQLEAMIRTSSNSAATHIMELVGREYVNELLQSEEYRLYDTGHNGGLWVGKTYSKEPAFQRDPLHQLSHGATAIQVARFFYLLETGRLLNPEYTARMKAALANPKLSHKFVATMKEKRPKARLYRKSGTWRNYHADAALIERAERRYVAVAMAESPHGEKWLRSLIAGLDELIGRLPPPCQEPAPAQS